MLEKIEATCHLRAIGNLLDCSALAVCGENKLNRGNIMKAVHCRKFFLTLLLFTVCLCVSATATTVTIVSDELPGLPVQHGLGKVIAALQEKGVEVSKTFKLEKAGGDILLVAGLPSSKGAAATLMGPGISPPAKAESLLVKNTEWKGKSTVLVAGADDRGLMYALLDIADRISWAKSARNPFSKVVDIEEEPYVPERALSIYAMHQKLFERRFHDVAQWEQYLDMLAKDRFNTFVLILGYSPATYLAPPYPFFFDVEGFPQVYVPDLSKEQQRRNLGMLKKLIQMTHDRGLDFTLGIWDHVPRKSKSPGYEFPEGVTTDNLVPYTMAAVPRLLELVPDIDAIQFRMHWESGLTREETPGFWINVLKAIAATGADVRIDARAKGLPDEVIDEAVNLGLDFRITTKYWMEQMGMPFHPTHINPKNQKDRRHGYADLLKYPQRYKMHWKLWNGGTTRVLLWGDPEYVRRFSKSTFLYNGEGFEINEPLATKMALRPEEEPFELLGPEYQYYDYEFERYWHFFQVWGRLSYNPNTPEEVWKKEFEGRFGDAAPYVESGLHSASNILPRIVAYTYPYGLFPTLGGWPEKRRHESLQVYAAALPSDTEQFLSIDQAAKNMLEGEFSAKIHPYESSKWFADTAHKVLASVKMAEKKMGRTKNKEFDSTMVDLRILAHLSAYHSWRAKAGVSYALFKHSKDLSTFDDALNYESKAIESWRQIVEAAGDVYNAELIVGRPSGHWRDELAELEKEFKALKKMRDEHKRKGSKGKAVIAYTPTVKTPGWGPWFGHTPVTSAQALKPLKISASVRYTDNVKWIRLRYRSVTQFEDYKTLEMKLSSQGFMYEAVVPAEDLKPEYDFMYFIEYMDKEGNGMIFPIMEHEAPYYIVKLQRD